MIGQRGGCIIVDSTRKGKRFPDSMSKTIPIWACVLNRAIENRIQSICEEMATNEHSVSSSWNHISAVCNGYCNLRETWYTFFSILSGKFYLYIKKMKLNGLGDWFVIVYVRFLE